MKIKVVYFSATGITQRYADAIGSTCKELGHSVELLNIIKPINREVQFDGSSCDFVFFGFPVFSGRLPTIAEEWLQKIEGNNCPCAMFFTYGARDLEFAHQIGFTLLSRAGFQVKRSAEFIGKHSFCVARGWSLAEDRPNDQDFSTAKEFVYESFDQNNRFEMKIGYEYSAEEKKPVSDNSPFLPFRAGAECSMCRLCEEECPTASFDAQTGASDRNLCILCMQCVSICPENVIEVKDVTEGFKRFMKRTGLNKNIVKNKKSRILSSFPVFK